MPSRNAFHAIADALDRGGSGLGISYYEAYARCARHARLSEEEKYRDEQTALFSLSKVGLPKGRKKLIATEVGTAVHVLLEPDVAMPTADELEAAAASDELKDAVRIATNYQKKWGSVWAKWEFTRFEYERPLWEPEHADLIIKLYGHLVTGRLDYVGIIRDPQRVEQRIRAYEMERDGKWYDPQTEFRLNGPGVYLHDVKTDGADKGHDEHMWKYRFSQQANHYLQAFIRTHPDIPVRGLITDVLYKTKSPKWRHYLTLPNDCNVMRTRNLIHVALENKERDLCNPTGCNTFISSCWFYKMGHCRGY